MRKTLLAASMLTAMAALAPAMAQTTIAPMPDSYAGKQAGTFMVRLRAIGVLPQNSSSSVSGIGGNVEASNAAAPELDVSYFLTDNIAIEGIAASTRHNISVKNSVVPGTVEVGSAWVLPPTVLLQYHFMPKERFSPYIGAGLNVSFFYATHGTGLVNKFNLETGVGGAIQAGFDYNVSGNWFLNVDVKQIFVRTAGDVGLKGGGQVRASTWLNPTVVGVGVGYRF